MDILPVNEGQGKNRMKKRSVNVLLSSTTGDNPNSDDERSSVGSTNDFWEIFHEELVRDEGEDFLDKKNLVLNKMRKNGLLCDIVVLANDETEFLAHQSALASCSEYFFRLLTGKFGEEVRPRIKLYEIDPDTLELILEFAYTSNIKITSDNVESLLRGSSYLRIANLIDRCRCFLSSSINVENCLDFRALAICYACPKFLSFCNKFIKENFREVLVKTEKFLDLSVEDLLEFVKSDEINVPDEEMVYNAVMTWVKHDIEKNKSHLLILMKSIRFSQMDESTLFDIVLPEPLFETNLECLIFIKKAVTSVMSNRAELTCDLTIPRTSYSFQPVIYVVCGKNQSTCFNSVVRFDFAKKQWSPVTSAPSRIFSCAAVVANNKIHVLGGYEEHDDSYAINDVQIYDIEIGQWSTGKSTSGAKACHGALLVDDRIYEVGGECSHPTDVTESSMYYNEPSSITSKLGRYFCIKNNNWHTIESMNQERSYVATAVLNGSIYAVGGCYCICKEERILQLQSNTSLRYIGASSTGSYKISYSFQYQYLNTAECYDPKTDSWKTIAPMSYERAGSAVVVLNNHLYVIGGFDGSTYLNSVEVYDPELNSWSNLAALSTPRAYAGTFCHKNRIYIVGGCNDSSTLNSMEQYDVKKNSWSTCSETLPEGRKSFGLVVTYESNHSV